MHLSSLLNVIAKAVNTYVCVLFFNKFAKVSSKLFLNLLLQQAELSFCMLSAVDVLNPNLKHRDNNYNHSVYMLCSYLRAAA